MSLIAKIKELTKDIYFVSTPVPLSGSVLKAWPKEWSVPWWRGMTEAETQNAMTQMMQADSIVWTKPKNPMPIDSEMAKHIDHVVQLQMEVNNGFDMPAGYEMIHMDNVPLRKMPRPWRKMLG